MGLVVEEIYGQEKVKAELQEEYTPYRPQKGYGWAEALPARQGLYDPELEKDACGVGFAALGPFHRS
jgi:glutamate synthase (NADH)